MTIGNGSGPVSAGNPESGNIVFVGTWLPRKGSSVLPRAFAEAAAHDPSLRLTLVGPGPAAVDLFPDACRARIRATGFVSADRVEEELRAADLVVLPSYFEGMPLALLEAMRFGVPTVAFDVEGSTAAAQDAGLFAPVGDWRRLADLLVRVVQDRGLRARLSDRATAIASSRSWDAMAGETVRAYEVARSSRRARQVAA